MYDETSTDIDDTVQGYMSYLEKEELQRNLIYKLN